MIHVLKHLSFTAIPSATAILATPSICLSTDLTCESDAVAYLGFYRERVGKSRRLWWSMGGDVFLRTRGVPSPQVWVSGGGCAPLPTKFWNFVVFGNFGVFYALLNNI